VNCEWARKVMPDFCCVCFPASLHGPQSDTMPKASACAQKQTPADNAPTTHTANLPLKHEVQVTGCWCQHVLFVAALSLHHLSKSDVKIQQLSGSNGAVCQVV